MNGRDFFRLTGYGDIVLVEGEEYEFRLVSDTSIGPSKQGGPTGCNRMFLPHFVRYSDGAIVDVGVRHIAGSDYPFLWVLHQTQEGRGVSYLMLQPYDGYCAVIRHDYSPANEGD